MEAQVKTCPCCRQFSDPGKMLLFVKGEMHLHSGWAELCTIDGKDLEGCEM